MDLITERLKLIETPLYVKNPGRFNALATQHGIKAENIELIRKASPVEVLDTIEGERSIVSAITTETMDRDEELVLSVGGMLDYYLESPVVLYAHNYGEGDILPIAKTLWLKKEPERILAKKQYMRHGLAEDIWQMARDGLPLPSSIGFISWKGREPDDKDMERWPAFKGLRYIHVEWELMEHSDVPVASNREALAVAVSKGMRFQTERAAADIRAVDDGFQLWQVAVDLGDDAAGAPYFMVTRAGEKPEGLAVSMESEKGAEAKAPEGKQVEVEIGGQRYSMTVPDEPEPEKDAEPPEAKEPRELIIEGKGVIPYRIHGDGPMADEATEWDGPGEVAAATVDDLKIMCAWVNSENAENKGGYKLPHHKAAGEHPVVWRGVAAAMMALLGGRGGVDIPEGDRRGVYNHLARHYKQFDKPAPEFKIFDPAELKCEACGGSGFKNSEPCVACGAWGYNKAGVLLDEAVWGTGLEPQFTYRAVYQTDTEGTVVVAEDSVKSIGPVDINGAPQAGPETAPLPPIAPAGEMAEYISVIKEHNTLIRANLEAQAEAKEGRVLSGKNRTSIKKAIDGMREAVDALEGLLEATEQDKGAEAAAEKAEPLYEIDPDSFGKEPRPTGEHPGAEVRAIQEQVAACLNNMDLVSIMEDAQQRARGRI